MSETKINVLFLWRAEYTDRDEALVKRYAQNPLEVQAFKTNVLADALLVLDHLNVDEYFHKGVPPSNVIAFLGGLNISELKE